MKDSRLRDAIRQATKSIANGGNVIQNQCAVIAALSPARKGDLIVALEQLKEDCRVLSNQTSDLLRDIK